MIHKAIILKGLLGILLAFCLAWTAGGTFGTGAGGASYTEEFFWDGSQADTKDGLTANRTTNVDGTLANAAVVVAGSTDPGTASTDGGNCLKLDAWSSYCTWPVTSGDVFSSAAGYLECEVYATNTTGVNLFFKVVSGTDLFYFRVNADNTIAFRCKVGAVDETATSSDTITDSTWTKVYFRWSAALDNISVKVGTGSWVDRTCTGLTAMGAEPSVITAGDNSTGTAGDFYLDGIKIWSTYDGS